MAQMRVRARAVEMLGRQQIAGAPTAISELFKNAHDAYADNVVVDYYRFDKLFVLRDDGLGMTKKDFLDRWLIIGTESKLDAAGGIASPVRDSRKKQRPILGEKGIGRLAVAAIGSQVLILSRADRDRPQKGVAAFIHWGIFALPGIDLSAVEIPVREFAVGKVPDELMIRGMVGDVKSNLESMESAISTADMKQIRRDLDAFKVDPAQVEDFLPDGGPRLSNGRGTHFYIQPTESTLEDDIDTQHSSGVAPPLKKVLVGFSNTMTPGHPPPRITAQFRDHQVDGVMDELIGNDQFFTPDEYENADHHFSGTFDEYGQFQGTVKVFDQDSIGHVVSWDGGHGKTTQCGPFSVNFAYVQGVPRESTLTTEEHGRMAAKLDLIGGLYIFRDGIRVLPYGNSDYDFLNIERRRTKSASFYFFSFRRMFGVVDISRKNKRLIEKAGREGFTENKAYKQLKSILENFFVQLAADFFREKGLHASVFLERKQELERDELLRRKRKKQVREKRDVLQKDLEEFFERAVSEAKTKADELLTDAELRTSTLVKRGNHPDVPPMCHDLQVESLNAIATLRSSFKINRPRGVGLTRQLERDWSAYLSENERLERDVFSETESRLEQLFLTIPKRLSQGVSHRQIVKTTIETSTSSAKSKVYRSVREVNENLSDAKERALTVVSHAKQEIEDSIQEALVQFSGTDLDGMSERQILAKQNGWVEAITEVTERETSELAKLRHQLQTIATEEGLEATEITGALESELEELRERESDHIELAQIGMAIGIVHHEFAAANITVRNGLRSLKRWADKNEKFNELYTQIRAGFDHLDGYLTLFTPLNRRLYRKKVTITGQTIAEFLTDLFGLRLERHGVTLEVAPSFSKMSIKNYPSSFLPCFANLVDNSIHSLSRSRQDERKIKLHARSNAFYVSDNGLGVRVNDRESIFEVGFSRRSGGRGMGLYISRKTLRAVGYDLTLAFDGAIGGATFRIAPKED